MPESMTTDRTSEVTNAASLPLGEKLIGHGMVYGIQWPYGVCTSCGGRLVNMQTGEGHGSHTPSEPPAVTEALRRLLAWADQAHDETDTSRLLDHLERHDVLDEARAALATTPPAPVAQEPSLDEVKRRNVAEFLEREALKRDNPERLALADALGEMDQYEYEDKYARALALLSRLSPRGIRLTVVAAEPQAAPGEVDLPDRIVVDANGNYWRDYRTHYSMCPVSEDNDAIVVLAEYRRQAASPGEGER